MRIRVLEFVAGTRVQRAMRHRIILIIVGRGRLRQLCGSPAEPRLQGRHGHPAVAESATQDPSLRLENGSGQDDATVMEAGEMWLPAPL